MNPFGPRHWPPPPVPGAHHSYGHGFLIAGRTAIALVTVVVLAVTGWEWVIKSRADDGVNSRSVQAIVTDDSNISTATVAPPAPGAYAAGKHPAARLGHPVRRQRRRLGTVTPAPTTGWPTPIPR